MLAWARSGKERKNGGGSGWTWTSASSASRPGLIMVVLEVSWTCPWAGVVAGDAPRPGLARLVLGRRKQGPLSILVRGVVGEVRERSGCEGVRPKVDFLAYV